MEFNIEFHGPFRIGTGVASRGMDETVDVDQPLPATALKGLMRASASQLLGDHPLVAEVYGSSEQASPWSWTSGVVRNPQLRQRARVALDPITGTAVDHALQFSEELWADGATFSVDQHGFVDPEAVADHALVLRASAAGVTSLGADRRRGFGWVSVRSADAPLDRAAADRLGQRRRDIA